MQGYYIYKDEIEIRIEKKKQKKKKEKNPPPPAFFRIDGYPLTYTIR